MPWRSEEVLPADKTAQFQEKVKIAGAKDFQNSLDATRFFMLLKLASVCRPEQVNPMHCKKADDEFKFGICKVSLHFDDSWFATFADVSADETTMGGLHRSCVNV